MTRMFESRYSIMASPPPSNLFISTPRGAALPSRDSRSGCPAQRATSAFVRPSMAQAASALEERTLDRGGLALWLCALGTGLHGTVGARSDGAVGELDGKRLSGRNGCCAAQGTAVAVADKRVTARQHRLVAEAVEERV